MKAKDYLSQAYKLDHRIDCKLRQTENLRDLATRATASIHAERVSGTKQRSPMENAIVKLIDLENEINSDIDRLVDMKREIAVVISKISSPSHKILLELRYLEGKTWDEIAKAMDYDLRWIYRLHGKALKEIEVEISNTPLKFTLGV